MLGDVSPQTLRVVASGVVYPGRDHVDALDITRWDGRASKSLDFSGVTRMVLVLLGTDPQIAFDSELQPDSLWVEGPRVLVDLSTYALDAATYETHLLAYDAEHPRGQVLVDNRDTKYQIDVRLVSEPGTVPPPLVDYVRDAPDDGGLYARQRGAWVLVPADITISEAGEAMSALRVVYEANGVARYLDYRDEVGVDLLLGVTTTSAGIGEVVNVQRKGAMDDPSWSWTLGSVWLGVDGQLTQTPATTGFDVLIGSATSPTRLLVNPQRPISLE